MTSRSTETPAEAAVRRARFGIENLIDRYMTATAEVKTINVASYARHGTIEIRQHQGTINATKILTWVHLGQALIAAAKARTDTGADGLDGMLGALNLTTADRNRLRRRATALAA